MTCRDCINAAAKLPHELPPNTLILPWREAGTMRQIVLAIRWMWDFRSPE